MKNIVLRLFFKIIGKLAKIYINKKKVVVIGVTGSVGKTSARMAIYASLNKIFEDRRKIYTPFKNYNGELGLSLAILQQEEYVPSVGGLIKVFFRSMSKAFFKKPSYDVIVLEYGIDHLGEMDFMLNIVTPDFGVLTVIDKVHAQYLSDPDIIANEKYKMIFASKRAVFLNWEDSYAHSAQVGVNKFWFLTRAKELFNKENLPKVDICFEGYQLNQNFETTSQVCVKDRKFLISTDVIAPEIFSYIGIGITISDIVYYTDTKRSLLDSGIDELNFSIPLLGGRNTVLRGTNDSIIIDSTYNAAPASMKKMIQLANFLTNKFFPDRNILLLLGDMRELGDFEESEHRQLAGTVSQVADVVVLVGPKMKKYLMDELKKIGFITEKFNKDSYPIVKRFCSAPAAGGWVKEFLLNSDKKWLVLAKGSQNTIFLEEAVKQFVEGDHKKKLVRQEPNWLKIKQNFFKRLDNC